MQQECTELIIKGLSKLLLSHCVPFACAFYTELIRKRTKVKMNWENYIKMFVKGKGVGLVG
jgi:hypothetical protein